MSCIMRKFLLLSAGILLGLPPLWAATLSDDAQRQLTSQTAPVDKRARDILGKFVEKPEIVIEEKKEEKSVQEEGPPFFVKKIKLEGNQIIPSRTFEKVIPPFENRSYSFNHLAAFAEIVTNIYRSQGYVTSRAYVPPQTVKDDTVTVKVLEGRVGKIYVEGNKYFDSDSYIRYFKFGRLRRFRYQDLESGLYRLNQHPDRRAKAYLLAGEKLGRSDIILKVKDSDPSHFYYDFNNHGTKLTHYGRYNFHLDHDNLFGFDDSLSTTVTVAEEHALEGYSFAYNFPLENIFENIPASLSLSGGVTKSRLVGALKPSEIRGKSESFSPGITYSLVRKPEEVIQVFLGFNYLDSISNVNDVRVNADRARSLQLGPRISFQGSGGRTIINADVHIGLPGFFGGLKTNDSNASVRNSGGDFTYYTVNVARLQSLPASMIFIARAGGQWTSDTLPSTEQYRAGGAYTVRGYQESEAGGDYGWSCGAEVNAPVFFLPKSFESLFLFSSFLILLVPLDGVEDGSTIGVSRC